MDLRVRYSKHAVERMVLRGISRNEVQGAIRLGTKTRQQGRIVAAYRYFEVVYVAVDDRIFVITVKPRW
jgi:hypothetical protein